MTGEFRGTGGPMTDLRDISVAPEDGRANWFCERGDFWGTVKQLTLCAKCGKSEIKPYDEPRYYSRLFTAKGAHDLRRVLQFSASHNPQRGWG